MSCVDLAKWDGGGVINLKMKRNKRGVLASQSVLRRKDCCVGPSLAVLCKRVDGRYPNEKRGRGCDTGYDDANEGFGVRLI